MSEAAELNLSALLRQARRGDVDAFAQLVVATERMALAVCRRILGNTADAVDAVQGVPRFRNRRVHSKVGTFRVLVHDLFDPAESDDDC